jgi:acetyltransferase-like isoleucine patch superfamily enzyme
MQKRPGSSNYKRGAALLLSFMVMITLISVTGAYLTFVQYATRNIGSQIEDSQALYLAEAGIHKAIWYLKNTAPDGSTDGSWRTTAYPADPGPNPTDPQQESLGQGTYTMWVETVGSDIRIYARGTVQGQSRIVQQDVTLSGSSWATAFNYAIYGDDVSNQLELKDDVTINGHVYYDYDNGSVEVEEDASVSNPYYVYANSVSGDGSYTQAPSAPDPVPTFPAFDTTTYDNAITTAEAQASGNWELSGSDTYDLNGGTVYYNGKVTIKDNATITGSGTIVATDDVKVEDNANISSNVTLISKKKVEIKNNAVVQSEAVLYARDEVKLKNNANVTGSLIVTTSGKKIKMEGDSILTGIIYGSKAELKDDATINGAVVVDSFKDDKIKDNVTINYNSSYLPGSIPTGLETGGNDIDSVVDTWQEI